MTQHLMTTPGRRLWLFVGDDFLAVPVQQTKGKSGHLWRARLRARQLPEVTEEDVGISEVESYSSCDRHIGPEDARLQQAQATEEVVESGVVQLITLHSSKGLEFDNVWIVGCGRQPSPH